MFHKHISFIDNGAKQSYDCPTAGAETLKNMGKYITSIYQWLITKPQQNKAQLLVAALLALGEGNPPVTGGFPSQRASNLGFDGHDAYCDITVMVFIFQGACCNKCW